MVHAASTLRDEQLVRAARAGETVAFGSLVERHFGLVYFIALARLHDAEAAEDLAQEVFLRAFMSIDRLEHLERFTGWLSQIARNLAVNWLRRRQRRSELVPMVPLEEVEATAAAPGGEGARETVETRQRDLAVQRAIERLPAEQQELVLLHFAEDLSQAEIAERLGVHQTTVSRRIQRALAAMRGSLEPVLRESAPRLRPPRTATVRTVTLIAAAGAMSGTSRAALAAAMASTGGGASAAKTGVGAGILSLLKSIPAMFAGGGAAMGIGKGVAVVVAVGAVAGGAYVMTRKGDPQTPAPAPPPAAPAAVAAPPPAPPAQTFSNWNEYIRAYLAQHPDDEGLRHLLAATEQFDTTPVLPQARSLDAILASGWTGAQPQIVSLIQSQAPALQEATLAAESASLEFPAAESPSTPVPNFLQLQLMNKLMLAEARRLEANGDPDRAANRAVRAAQLAAHLRFPGTFVIQHLIGIANETLALKTLESILRQPGLSAEAIRWVGSQLWQLDQGQAPFSDALQSESHCLVAALRQMRDDPAFRQQTLSSMPSDADRRNLEAALADLPAFEAEQSRFWSAVDANVNRPFWEREPIDEAWARRQTSNPLLISSFGNWGEAATRADVATAHLRLCEALCALRLAHSEALSRFPDPFTGQPLRVGNDRIWSLGPDRQDQGGRVPYDPTNGTVSPGDIVALR